MHTKTSKTHSPRGLQAPNTAKHRLQAADQNNSNRNMAMDDRYTAPSPALWPIGNHGFRGACDNTRCSGISRGVGYFTVSLID